MAPKMALTLAKGAEMAPKMQKTICSFITFIQKTENNVQLIMFINVAPRYFTLVLSAVTSLHIHSVLTLP